MIDKKSLNLWLNNESEAGFIPVVILQFRSECYYILALYHDVIFEINQQNSLWVLEKIVLTVRNSRVAWPQHSGVTVPGLFPANQFLHLPIAVSFVYTRLIIVVNCYCLQGIVSGYNCTYILCLSIIFGSNIILPARHSIFCYQGPCSAWSDKMHCFISQSMMNG